MIDCSDTSFSFLPESSLFVTWPLLPPSYEQTSATPAASSSPDRPIRERNKISYRLNHWPIWIFVFFIAPGPMTFELFEHGFTAACCVAGGRPGRHGDRRAVRQAARRRAGALHHPLHRRPAEPALSPHLLHGGVERGDHVRRAQHRRPRLGDRHRRVAAAADVRGRVLSDRRDHLAARRAGQLPRVKRSTKGEGHERR